MPLKQPGLKVIAGDGASDTALALLASDLTVEVIGANGRPATSVTVVFTPTIVPQTPIGPQPSAFVGRFGVPDQESSVDTTDASGQASTRVRLGRFAGEAKIIARSNIASDTASFTVRPVAPAYFRLLPRDTALYVGNSFTYGAYAFDRHGNVRSGDTLSTRILVGPLSTDGAGRITGTSFGEGVVIARLGQLEDTARVGVVPRASLAVSTIPQLTGDSAHLVVVDADGSAYRVLFAAPFEPSLARAPYWSPTNPRIVFQHNVAGGWLHTIDLDGTVRRLIPVGSAPRVQLSPQYSSDGAWVYFSAGSDSPREMWRVRSDGTGAEQIGPAVPGDESDTQPSPSPDGKRVAYVSSRQPLLGSPWPTLWILDLASGASTNLGVTASAPRWSPDGLLIAYSDPDESSVNVIRPDGSGRRTVNAPMGRIFMHYGLDWSPDSKWIVTSIIDGLAMIEVATTLTIPIRMPVVLGQPSWRR